MEFLRLYAFSAKDREIYKVAGQSQVKELLSGLGGKVKRVNSAQTMPRYRYLINVAAVLSSWRLVELLATKSVLLLQECADHELILDWLTPWEHYVPLSPGLSDLVQKLHWLEANQWKAREIAEAGFRRFSQRVRRHDTWCYIWQTFQSLAEIQTAPKVEELERLSGWKEVKRSGVSSLPDLTRPEL